MRKFVWITAAALCLAPTMLFAQNKHQVKEQIELTREVIKAEKKRIVSANMDLTEQEAKGFWPVYDEYQKALGKLNDREVKLIEDYAKNYNTMTDEKANSLLNEALTIDADRVKLFQSYRPKFEKVLPAKKVARYYQIENKMDAVISYELARSIPLVK